MNVPKAYEIALATVLREKASVGKDTVLRAWQSLKHDGTWNKNKDRTFPCVDIRAAPPAVQETQVTMTVDAIVLCGTAVQDDPDHAQMSGLYGSVQVLLDKLFDQSLYNRGGPELVRFLAVMAENVPASGFDFGGFTFGPGLSPYEEKGANMIGITLVMHYTRTQAGV